jgi:putative ABC transport system permease protein
MAFFGRIAGVLFQALGQLWRHKLRSVLTMFGVGWGVIALALITASGAGFRQGQRENIRQIGDSIVLLWGGRTEMQAGGERAGRNIRLFREDVEVIRRQCPAIATVAPEVKTWNVPVESPYNSGSFLVVGVDPEYLKIRNLPAASGRNVRKRDVDLASRVCVLGDSVRKQLFEDRTDAIGKELRINGFTYSVVGLMSAKEQNSSYDGWDNDKILVPSSSLLRDCPASRATAVEGQLYQIIYKAKSEDLWEPAQAQIRRTLGKIHNFHPEDREALQFWDTVKESVVFDRIFQSIGNFLAAIALVTLSLGGVSVMNTMYTTVAERTSEIGLKKALGAKRSRIMAEFFTEGFVLATLSGGIGVLLALGLASFVNSFPMPAYFSGLPIDVRLVIRLAVVLASVAVLAALPPAWRASRMDPIVALNQEK